MMMYTIISYRENDAVYRGGYCDGSTNSAFDMETTESREEAVGRLSDFMYFDKRAQDRTLNKDYEFTAPAEILLGIDGYFGTTYATDWIDLEKYQNYCADLKSMTEEAKDLAESKYQAHLERYRELLREKSEKAHAQTLQWKEAREREELARLKEKYGE